MFVSVGVESASIVQDNDRIGVIDTTGEHGCFDGTGVFAATVNNADAVHVVSDGDVTIDASRGAFAPGFTTPEATGFPEIEFDVAFTARSVLAIDGGTGSDDMVIGVKGVNVNGDDDADVTFVNASRVVLNAGSGDDALSAQGGSGTGAPANIPLELWGQEGDDVIDGGSGSDILVGGPGSDDLDGRNGTDWLYALDPNPAASDDPSVSDLLDGGRGNDFLYGGPGQDILRGSEGDDTIHADDGRADRVNGGKGIDTALLDPGLDFVSGVELPPGVSPAGE